MNCYANTIWKNHIDKEYQAQPKNDRWGHDLTVADQWKGPGDGT